MSHAGQTAWIIGKGPSLLRLTPEMIGDGPVITLNEAIRWVRPLKLPNPVYVFQKDGCVSHGPTTYVPEPPGHVCQAFIIRPEPPEVALFSLHESPNCLADYRPRIVVDVESFGLPWYTPSAPTAVKIAQSWGCSGVVLVANDAYAVGDFSSVTGARPGDPETAGYRQAGELADRLAHEAGMEIRWLTP